MAHTDTVNVDPDKWQHPPFSARARAATSTAAARWTTRTTSRRADDDGDAEAPERAARSRRDLSRRSRRGGRDRARRHRVHGREHFDKIDAEFCLAEGGNVTRQNGKVRFASVQTMEKIPRAIQLTPRVPPATARCPCSTTPWCTWPRRWGRRRSGAPTASERDDRVPTSSAWRRSHAGGGAALHGHPASRPRGLRPPPDDHLPPPRAAPRSMLRSSHLAHDHRRAATASTSFRPRPRAARHPPRADGRSRKCCSSRCAGGQSIRRSRHRVCRLGSAQPAADTDGQARYRGLQGDRVERHPHYDTVTLPTMSTGATDMAYLRAQGHAVLRHRPGGRRRGWPEGVRRAQRSGAHPRSELYRFVRFHYDVVAELARAR
jgi:hypothetical protein